MVQDVYLVVVSGSDRVFASTTYPESYVRRDHHSRVFRVQVELCGIEVVDGVLQMVAEDITMRSVSR